MRKKKILLISQQFYPEIGSAGNRMKNMFLLLKDSGYEVTVITAKPTYPEKQIYEEEKFWDEESFSEEHNQYIHRVDVSNHKSSLNHIWRLMYYVEIALKMLLFVLKDKSKYDFVLATSPPIFIGIVGLFAKFRYRCRMILDIRDLWPESLRGVGVFDHKWIIGFFNIVEKFLYVKSDHILVNSPGFIEYIIQKANIRDSKISFLPNAARQSELQSEAVQNKEFKVIYAGNIGLAQDVDLLKGLTKKLNAHNIKISIAGYGIKKKELTNFVREENLQNTYFISPMTRAECLKVNSEHHVGLVSLTNKEVFDTVIPGKVIDYISCGVPMVAAVSGYSKDLIEKYKVGFVSENRNIDEILHYILKLSENPKLRKKMADNCDRCIKRDFLWEKNIQKVINLLESKESDLTSAIKAAGRKRKAESL
ncbi:glycosyltransferase family 4 protein [Cytobacillus sp.]|uniref:glycosyltransferase family 4 protein n=1 Tax=Cytobacillus sp. TaxID=2675269 RepID=UPI0035167A12